MTLVDERPRERLLRAGPDALTDAELVAVVLGTANVATGQRLLGRLGGARGLLAAGLGELSSEPGIGQVQAMRLLAAVALGRRAMQPPPDAHLPIRDAKDVYQRLAARMAGLDREQFVALALDSKHRVVRELVVATGSLSRCEVHPRDTFRPLLREMAVAVVFAHNHPSGDPLPSEDDLLLTRRLAAVGSVIGMPVLDHVIVAGTGFTSLAERTGLAATW